MHHTFKIESGLPVPPRAAGFDNPNSYPLAEMNVGDSFLVPEDIAGRQGNRVRSAAHRYGRLYSRKFSVHKVDGGYRCWRRA